jgi:hypothetical protein
MHADHGGSDGPPTAHSGAGAASEANPEPAASRASERIGAPASTPAPVADARLDELRTLFHTLNNQLGVVITYAELLEAKAPDEGLRARATQVLTAALEALSTSKQIRQTVSR